MVPVIDLSRRMRKHHDEFIEHVERVMRSGHVLLGPELDGFEAEFAAYTGRRHCVAVGSGAAALELAMVALGIGPGDEVLVPAMTAVPTAAAVCATGATPVFVEIDPITATIDPASAAEACTPRTRAVVPVHLYGRPAVLPDLGLPIIEDAAQAHGATDPQAPSAMQCFSFYPTKNLGGMGDGGAIVTDDDDLDAQLRRLRVHGMREQYVHTEIAMNSRLSELEAAWLRITLPHLDAGNARRRAIADHYASHLPHLAFQPGTERHARHLCVARVAERAAFRDRAAGMGIATAIHYPLALTQQPAYRRFVRSRCPNAEAWASQCVSLPCFPELTDYEVELVVKALS